MDELNAVRAFRAIAPEPDAITRSKARDALEHEMSRNVAATLRWRIGHTRVVATVSVAVAILVAVALASPILGLRDGDGNAAARELHTLANVAAQQPSAPALAAGQYTYTRSDNVQMDTVIGAHDAKPVTTLESFTREIWIGADGSGRIRQAGQGSGSRDMDQLFGPGELTPPLDTHGFTESELMQLAQHPDQLAQAIAAGASGTKNPVNQESFVIVGDLLRESGAPASLRAALFQVAAGIPGVELVGNVTDLAGRSGVSVAITSNGIRSELIFDRQSSMLLAERQTIVAPVADLDFPIGTVISSMTYLSSGVVDSTTATP